MATIMGRQDKSRIVYMATIAKVEVEEEIHPEVMEVDTREPTEALEKISSEMTNPKKILS